MADEEEETNVDNSVDGPGKDFEIYLLNEELVDKLKLLDYEDKFLKMNRAFKPIQRHYFVRQSNPGEQFFLFTSLAVWLASVCNGTEPEMPQELDDPNIVSNNIVAELRNKGVAVDFAANKLKSGAGEHVLFTLNELADQALAAINFQWQKMIPPVEEDDAVDVDSDNGEESDGIDSDEYEIAEDDDDNAILIDLAAPLMQTDNTEEPLREILKSDVDVAEWKAEVERVAPQLKITIRQDAKDWRMHLEQMHSMHKQMEELIVQLNPQIEQVSNELETSLERIEIREKNLNSQLSELIARFRQGQDQRAETMSRYKSASVGITEREATLQRISNDVDQIKQQIEEEGHKNSDGAPLVKVKQAILKLEEEIDKMSVQIGVVEQTLLQSQLRERVAFSQAFAAY